MRKFESKTAVAESIGQVFGPYEERDGKHILHYECPDQYIYDNIDALLLDWLPTILYSHMSEAPHNPADSWEAEIDYILENVYGPLIMRPLEAAHLRKKEV